MLDTTTRTATGRRTSRSNITKKRKVESNLNRLWEDEMFVWGCGVRITGACWSTGGVNALCALRGSGRSAINPWRDGRSFSDFSQSADRGADLLASALKVRRGAHAYAKALLRGYIEQLA